jgi:hypothetical protein
MTKPTNLKTFKKKKLKEKAKAKTLCRSGLHRWTFDEKKQFDVKSGKLVSIQRCLRCGTTKTMMS